MLYGVKEFVYLSGVNFDPNYLSAGLIEWAKKNLGHLWQMNVLKNLFLARNN